MSAPDGAPAGAWAALRDFAIDEGTPALSFTARLARENGWSVHFAERVVDEYRRFLHLTQHAGHPVTPSEHVDQAWHLHLTYTRSYWGRLCTEVLRGPLHHGPTRGGRDEAAKYAEWYDRTLAAYASLFGAPPPADIWPPAAVRFGDDLRWRRVNLARCWVVPKRRAVWGLTALVVTAGVCVLAALAP